MNHSVRNVQELYDTALALYNDNVVGGESGADAILNDLVKGIDNLKENWRGTDAGVRIEEVVRVHNAMVAVRNALVQLAVDSSIVASKYREIQMANGARMDSLNPLDLDTKATLPDYSDNADTIYIMDTAALGKAHIDAANQNIANFENAVKAKYNELMDNWTRGTGRDVARDAFDAFIQNVNRYRSTLEEVSQNVAQALQNYE